MLENKINYFAVGVAALVPILVGVFWYSPLMFGEVWRSSHGFSDLDLQQIRESTIRTLLVSLGCYVVMALVLAILASRVEASTVAQGALLGGLVWVGFLATLGLTAHMFSAKPLVTYFLDAGFQLVYIVIMGAVLAKWR